MVIKINSVTLLDINDGTSLQKAGLIENEIEDVLMCVRVVFFPVLSERNRIRAFNGINAFSADVVGLNDCVGQSRTLQGGNRA